MTEELVPSDVALLDLLRKCESMSIGQLASAMAVTATAVRQRLSRLMAQGQIERDTMRAGRGRPSHQYRLTAQGRRRTGANFADLSIALWQEIRGIRDPEVRRGLLQRVARRMAEAYSGSIQGNTLEQRMQSLADLFTERRIPFEVAQQAGLPVLNALACPYPDLAEQDSSICSLERMLFAELLGDDVKLGQCRLNGASCCSFEPSPHQKTEAKPSGHA